MDESVQVLVEQMTFGLIALGHGALNLIKFAILLVAGLFITVFWLALKENPAPRRR